MNPELELEKARLANINTDGGKYETEGQNWLERTLPGVTEWWNTLTTPTEYHKPMKLEELSSSPAVAGELLSQYKSNGRGVTAQYTDPTHGAGKLYVNRQTGGEIRFIPTDKNQASYAQTAAQFQTMEGVQQAIQIAGMGAVGVRANRARIRQKQQGYNLAAEGAKNITPGQTAVKPNTAAGSLNYQSSRYDIGYDPVARAAFLRGINPKSQVKAMGEYGGKISTGEPVPTPSSRDKAWLLSEQSKKVMRALNRKDPDFDTAYDWLSTHVPWGGHVYQVASAKESGKKQHHKFPKYASAGFLLRMMELVSEGKADISDILQLHNLSYHYSLPMGGGRWGIQNVLADPHDAGHKLARDVDWEHKGRPFQKISKELLTINTPEELAYRFVDYIETKGKPSLEAMLSLEKTYQEAYGSLNPEQMRAHIFRKAREQADLIKSLKIE